MQRIGHIAAAMWVFKNPNAFPGVDAKLGGERRLLFGGVEGLRLLPDPPEALPCGTSQAGLNRVYVGPAAPAISSMSVKTSQTYVQAFAPHSPCPWRSPRDSLVSKHHHLVQRI